MQKKRGPGCFITTEEQQQQEISISNIARGYGYRHLVINSSSESKVCLFVIIIFDLASQKILFYLLASS